VYSSADFVRGETSIELCSGIQILFLSLTHTHKKQEGRVSDKYLKISSVTDLNSKAYAHKQELRSYYKI